MTSELARKRFLEGFVPHLDDAYTLARWLAGNSADAEDIVQEAALRALVALEQAAVLRPRAWTLAIVRNTAMTWLARRRPAAISYVGDLNDLEALDAACEEAISAEDALIAEETGERVRSAISALPSPLRETLVMREINGLSYKEIAEATEAPVGTVMSRLARARAAVARHLEDLR